MRAAIKQIKLIGAEALSKPWLWFSLSCFFGVLAILKHGDEPKLRGLAELFRGASAIAWPLLVMWAVWIFRREAQALIGRVRKFGPAGAEFADAAVSSQLANRPFEEIRKNFGTDGALGDVVTAKIKDIHTVMDTDVGDNSLKRETWLLEKYANAALINNALFNYLAIFRSQLEALEAMLASADPIDLRPFHELHVQRYTAATQDQIDVKPPLDFETWLRFLHLQNYVEARENHGSATAEGSAFIRYVRAQNLPRFQLF
ncbi:MULTISPECIES: hypothetical protein [Roseomonadaceae]|uniref:DUF4760 domain-containing protein n=1 Tax=Falsiroseomonas oleicola TaxID=2801474 RepID=A0ABS6H5Q9_9PROT|nr:hypothetical protein [Roseomonas oleicola]MBU8543177.1 hypothetical protein [Roseomonas oleicola]